MNIQLAFHAFIFPDESVCTVRRCSRIMSHHSEMGCWSQARELLSGVPLRHHARRAVGRKSDEFMTDPVSIVRWRKAGRTVSILKHCSTVTSTDKSESAAVCRHGSITHVMHLWTQPSLPKLPPLRNAYTNDAQALKTVPRDARKGPVPRTLPLVSE
jgi:hypothetical protein